MQLVSCHKYLSWNAALKTLLRTLCWALFSSEYRKVWTKIKVLFFFSSRWHRTNHFFSLYSTKETKSSQTAHCIDTDVSFGEAVLSVKKKEKKGKGRKKLLSVSRRTRLWRTVGPLTWTQSKWPTQSQPGSSNSSSNLCNKLTAPPTVENWKRKSLHLKKKRERKIDPHKHRRDQIFYLETNNQVFGQSGGKRTAHLQFN